MRNARVVRLTLALSPARAGSYHSAIAA